MQKDKNQRSTEKSIAVSLIQPPGTTTQSTGFFSPSIFHSLSFHTLSLILYNNSPFVFSTLCSSFSFLHQSRSTVSLLLRVSDLRRFDADPNFHVDADPDSDRHQHDTEPQADPIKHVGKSELFLYF